MPASPSSPTDPAIGQLADLALSLAWDGAGLLTVLAAIADPRCRRGIRHRLPAVLGLAVCAALAGARSFTAIAEWAADADEATLAGLGVTGAVPSESTSKHSASPKRSTTRRAPTPEPGDAEPPGELRSASSSGIAPHPNRPVRDSTLAGQASGNVMNWQAGAWRFAPWTGWTRLWEAQRPVSVHTVELSSSRQAKLARVASILRAQVLPSADLANASLTTALETWGWS
jgi:hypothetical protein